MQLLSIQVGKPKTLDVDWTTAIYKQAVSGPLHLGKLNLEGDRQADLSVHGGVDKAVNVYPQEHYQYWNQRARFSLRKRIHLPRSFNGAFGENFTTLGFTEENVCIGDTFRVGTAIVQVSQPRQPCWKLARKFNQYKLPIWVQQTGKTGWYFRVIEEGEVEAGNTFELIRQTCTHWPLAKANRLMHSPDRSLTQVEKILLCDALSASWRNTFTGFLNNGEGMCE